MTKSSRIRKDKAIYEVHSNDSRLWHHLLQWPARDPEPQDNWNSASKASNYRAPASCSIHCSARVKRGKSFPAETPAAPTQPLTGSGAHSLLQLGIHGRLRGIGGCPFLSVLGSSCSGVLVFFFFFFYTQPMRHRFSSSKGTDFLKGILSGSAKLLESRHPHQQ